MGDCMLQKATLLGLRIYQILLLTVIFGLDFAQLQGGRDSDSSGQSHLRRGRTYYFILIFTTYILVLYYLTRFSYRWMTGPFKSEIITDIVLGHLWLISSLINTGYILNGCDSNASNATANDVCNNLFLSSVILNWIYTFSYIFSSYILIMRWRKRPIDVKTSKFVEPSSIEIHKPAETYVVQKGVLAGGQPALFFHMAQKISPNSSHNASKTTSVYLHGKDVKDSKDVKDEV